MRLLRRANLLVALSLLTSAATAYAEGAWVLMDCFGQCAIAMGLQPSKRRGIRSSG
jgi:hypothetical protein